MLSSDGESLSSVLGWISIACWIVVYSPQIYENYLLQSGEGLSVLFVTVWILGDLFNLIGAVLGGLLPTVIILACYYTICDLILLCQIYYFRWKRNRTGQGEHGEETPLLSGDDRQTVEITPVKIVAARYMSALLFVVAVGIAACKISNKPDVEEATTIKSLLMERWWLVQTLGWSSALLFLGARVPQILKNFKTRCEGLSPALFFFAIFGNTSYAWSICAKSMDRGYLIKNAGWLAGSTLTVLLDIFVLCQFIYYRATDTIAVPAPLSNVNDDTSNY